MKQDNTPRRAKGKAATSISLSEDTLEKARALAAQDDRSLSNYIERLINEKLKQLELTTPPSTHYENTTMDGR